jgi:hypothetical protein
MVVILIAVRWILNVILICISFMAKEAFECCLFSSFAHLLTELLIYCGINLLYILYIPVIGLL